MYGVLACIAAIKSTKGGKMLLDSDKHLEDITVKALMAKYRKSAPAQMSSIVDQGVRLMLE